MIVIKYGGHAMVNEELAESFASDVVALVRSGEQVVVVHGGGPQIDHELKAKGLTSTSVAGLRVTTPEMMNVVEMVLSGRVLRDVTNSLIQAGGNGRKAKVEIAKAMATLIMN